MTAGFRVEVHGDVAGSVVVGDHNLVVNAEVGSSVTVLQEAARPIPQRRGQVRLLPRRRAAALGRDAEIGAVGAAIAEETTTQVYGPSGIGKSTLLRHVAHQVGDETGVVFLALSGGSYLDVPQEVFEACYETSGYRPGRSDLRRLMAGIRVTVIADDLDGTPDQLNQLIDAVPDATFVFSGAERQLWGDGRVIELSGLSAAAAHDLARRELGRDLTDSERGTLAATWTATSGSPMAILRTAAAMARSQAPLATVLPESERDALALLTSVPRAAVTAPLVASMTAAPPGQTALALDHLVEAGFADVIGDAYRAADDLPAAPYRRSVTDLIEPLIAWVTASGRTPRDVAVHGVLIVRLIDAAVEAGEAAAGTRLARVAAPVTALSLRWSTWQDVLAGGQRAAAACGDDFAYAYFTHERGIRLLCLGQAAAAAAMLATAAGLWHALGATSSAAAATQAGTLAGGGAHAAGTATTASTATTGAATTGQVVGAVAVKAGVSIGLIATVTVGIAAVAAAAVLVVAHPGRHHTTTSPRPTTVVGTAGTGTSGTGHGTPAPVVGILGHVPTVCPTTDVVLAKTGVGGLSFLGPDPIFAKVAKLSLNCEYDNGSNNVLIMLAGPPAGDLATERAHATSVSIPGTTAAWADDSQDAPTVYMNVGDTDLQIGCALEGCDFTVDGLVRLATYMLNS